MTTAEIEQLANQARQAALSRDRGINGLKESKDSINKKLIFLVPFSEVGLISGLIKHFEDNFPQMYIDVEMTSLEDAYVKMVEGEDHISQENLLSPERNTLSGELAVVTNVAAS